MINAFVVQLGSFIELFGRRIKTIGISNNRAIFDVFLRPNAIRINHARLQHLDFLHLNLFGKRILEVGAGIGLLTGFFEGRGCNILSTDAREENVAEMIRRFPNRRVQQLDLDTESDLSRMGEFDIIFCYGTLYHLSNPERALETLASISKMILLETCVTPGRHNDVHLVREHSSCDQAIGQIGCRPTRSWIMEKLTKYWGYAYVAAKQPQHEDFEVDWVIPKQGLTRAVFVGSKSPLMNDNLLNTLPDRQSRLGELSR